MSDVSQGPGWWIASDGKWYAPELHPSVRDQLSSGASQAPTAPHSGTTGARSQDSPHAGPQFPDMFDRAMRANAVADTVSVRHHGDHGSLDFYAPSTAIASATKKRRRWGH